MPHIPENEKNKLDYIDGFKFNLCYDNGDANTGGGAGATAGAGTSGGSGVVIIKYPDTRTITVGGSLTSSTVTTTDYKMTIFTAGTDNVSFI